MKAEVLCETFCGNGNGLAQQLDKGEYDSSVEESYSILLS